MIHLYVIPHLLVVCFSAYMYMYAGLGTLLPLPAWAEGTVLSLCVCVCLSVCLSVCYHKIAVKFNYLKIKQATSHKLGNLRQKVVLYKTGKFLQASVVRVAFKFGNKKN